MSLDLVVEIWGEMKRYMSPIDRVEAADYLISILVDNDYAPEDIRSHFRSDSDIKKALTNYMEENSEEESDEEYAEEDEDDWGDDDY